MKKEIILVKVVGLISQNLKLDRGDIIVGQVEFSGLLSLAVRKKSTGEVIRFKIAPRGADLWGWHSIVVRRVRDDEINRQCLIAAFNHLRIMSTELKQKTKNISGLAILKLRMIVGV